MSLKLLLLLFLGASACKKTDPASPSQKSPVDIRVSNKTGSFINGITIKTDGNTQSYDSLAAGQLSSYRTYPSAYGIAGITFKIKQTIYSISPIDYVGEKLLESGRYTYSLYNIDSARKTFQLSVNKE